MFSWEDYEADYFGGDPEGMMGRRLRESERNCPVDRQGRARCAYDAGNMEMLRDLDEFELLMDTNTRDILHRIRELCDSMDGDGCIAMDGELSSEIKEMLVDRILEETKGDEQPDQAEMQREWIALLLFQELLRRRYHRRMRRSRSAGWNNRKRYPI